jgi:hypothetical protein
VKGKRGWLKKSPLFIRVQLIWNVEKHEPMYHPPLHDFTDLYTGLLDDLTDMLQSLAYVECDKEVGIRRSSIAQGRSMMEAVLGPHLREAKR